jgi:hypothetical protein
MKRFTPLRFVALCGTLTVVFALWATTTAHSQSRPPARTHAECVQRGIAYFREIGSWPTLSAPPNRGRSAVEVAEERCRRSLAAFP